jgi:hypothetical protein
MKIKFLRKSRTKRRGKSYKKKEPEIPKRIIPFRCFYNISQFLPSVFLGTNIKKAVSKRKHFETAFCISQFEILTFQRG